MYLIFDTETTGLPRNYNAPHTDSDNWPRLVQIAWLHYDSLGKQTGQGNYIVKPDGFIIPDEVAKIHGISTERAMKEGHDLRTILNKFSEVLAQSEILVAHNLDFDEKIVRAEFFRESLSDNISQVRKICTMKSPTVISFCELPGYYDEYKWPKLPELHYRLFETEFEEAHDASVDVVACAKCFFELKKLTVID